MFYRVSFEFVFKFPSHFWDEHYSFLTFLNDETEAQKSKVTCPGLFSW